MGNQCVMLPAMCDHTSIWNPASAFRISLLDQWMITNDPHFWQESPKTMFCQELSSSLPHMLLTFSLQWPPPTAETQWILLGIQVLEKEPGHHTQLGRCRWTPELLSKASWQDLTWSRRRERRNLKTPFPLSEQWAGNQSACQLLWCSCQAVVLLCRPGSTNYTFVFSPGPALLLPQLNTLKQGLLQLRELSWNQENHSNQLWRTHRKKWWLQTSWRGQTPSCCGQKTEYLIPRWTE